jgi:hypothetical protein
VRRFTLKILFALLLAYTVTVGGLVQQKCGIDTTWIDHVTVSTTQGQFVRPANELLDLAVYELKSLPKGIEFIGAGTLGEWQDDTASSYIIYRDADNYDTYYIELYVEPLTVVDDWGVSPCAVGVLSLN